MKLPPAKDIACVWGCSIDNVYSRTSGKGNTPTLDLVTLAIAYGLDVAELAEHFAARRRRYLERTGQDVPPGRAAEDAVSEDDRAVMRRIVADVAARAAAQMNACLLDSEDDDG